MKNFRTIIIEKHIGVTECNRAIIYSEIKNTVDFYFFNDFSFLYGIMMYKWRCPYEDFTR